jgi:hypothetical protein
VRVCVFVSYRASTVSAHVMRQVMPRYMYTMPTNFAFGGKHSARSKQNEEVEGVRGRGSDARTLKRQMALASSVYVQAVGSKQQKRQFALKVEFPLLLFLCVPVCLCGCVVQICELEPFQAD